ncbi:MAG: mannose-1-phosphate guanyltransferase [Candidatus Riflebacteria bacterium]|nr:mannose-1-phosphate guanyltransferase [Candidatus Riflebacteria bacterium]
MNAVIMAGGFGTRLRPITCNIPKPMVPVANIPMMEHIVNLLKQYNLKNICSILYFQPEIITKYFGDGSDFGCEMNYVMATADYGTAGSVKNAESKLKGEPFIIISGDVLTDFDLDKAIAFHREKKAMATMVLTRVSNPLEYGVVMTNDDGNISRFLEKPSWGEVFSDTINTGIYILEPDIFKYIPSQTEFDFSKNLFPLMLKENLPLFGYIADGYWKDIGDISEYRLAHRSVLDGAVQVNIPGSRLNMIGRDVWVGANSRIGSKVKLKGGVIIGANCQIEDGVELQNSILGDGCVVQAGARISDSILWERVYVGARVRMDEAIISNDTQIRDGGVIENGAVISEDCRIGENAIVRSNVKIWPRKVVEEGSTVFSSLVWSDKWTKNLFSNNGISGLANLEITPEMVCKVGAAFGSTLPKGTSVSTSRDSHNFSRIINRALICGLASAGIHAADLRVMPASVARFKLGAFNRAAGLHVNLSPNDQNHIEIKLFDNEGRDLSPSQQKPIERLFNREDFRRVALSEVGDITFPARVAEYYRDEMLTHLDVEPIKKKKMRIVVDYAFSGASTIFGGILGRLDCEVISLNAHHEESGAYRPPSEFRRSLEHIAQIVKSLGADVGLMLDPNGERLFFIDDQGRLVLGEQSLIAWVALILGVNPTARFAVPVSTTHVLETMAKKTGATVIRTKTSCRALMTAALQQKVVFCGDQHGGTIFPDFQPAFDGIMSAGRLLEYLAKSGQPLSKLIEELPKFYTESRQLPCPWEVKGKVMRYAMEFARDKETLLVDGIKVFTGEGEWVLILPDPDKPYVEITVESGSIKRAHELMQEMVKKVENWKAAEE